MGVKYLWDILESCKKILPLHHLQNKRLCIDLSCWVVQLQTVNRSHSAMTEKLYLKNLFHRLRALIALNCSLVFVSDGAIPAIKLATYRQRLKSGIEVSQDEVNQQKACSLKRNMGSEFSRMIKEAKALGLALGIPCLDGIEEGEAQCALLNSESLCDGCFSSDSDIFLFGARTVYRDICLAEGGHVVCYDMADIERNLGFGRKSLITLALLLGCDYYQGVHGLGPESACRLIKSVGENNIFQQIISAGLSFVNKTKCSKTLSQALDGSESSNPVHSTIDTWGSNDNSEASNPCLQVINAFLKPKCHSADSDEVHRVLANLPFQRAELQQICAQFFGWPVVKTDEYVLPKVAERDLRRFANLRSASSQLGVQPPLYQMAVKCPVTEIVKHRKVQGRDCFEVLWDRLDGLKTSIVSADLIESACPEKITEFEERKAQGKKEKQNKGRPKKLVKNTTIADLDSRLQALLLEIESEGNTAFSSSHSSKTAISNDNATLGLTNHEGLDAGSERSSEANTFTSCYASNTGLGQNQVIDLSSPSPPRNLPNFSGSLQTRNQVVDVIDLSDSETEVSPEHARKARELRLFIASIRDDIS
ncbi:hypothetical protein K2173_008699 [Erythroxylum novogranatense]|uniref:Flap endonuclease GEN-like 2 n=1 Tax=Erythroxylum novogranatense TaxID=1862640 RepID=A0AAV8SLR5_9ROSI|nr:hypothetical protein K2173_008699 [Erythroxylum novogranatense]